MSLLQNILNSRRVEVTASSMDQERARIGAQELDRESPKDEVLPNFEEKISDEASPHTSQSSIKPAKQLGVKAKYDVEAANVEEANPAPV